MHLMFYNSTKACLYYFYELVGVVKMNIQVSLFIISIIFFPLSFLIPFVKNNYNLSKNKRTKTVDDIFSKNETTVLKGIAALIISFHHFSLYTETYGIYSIIKIYKYIGFVLVALFLFISGYASYISYKTKKDKEIKQRGLLSKILKIYVPWLVVSLCVSFMTYKNMDYSVIKTILYTLCFGLVVNNGYINATWFLIAICYLLISFRISALISEKNGNTHLLVLLVALFTVAWVLICKILDVGDWWYMSIISYLFGVVVAIYKKSIVLKTQKNYWMSLFASTIFFAFMFRIWLKDMGLVISWLASLSFCALIFILCCKFSFENKIFEKIGNFSLEFFIIHINFLDFLLSYNCANNIIFFLTMTATYFLSKFLHSLVAKIDLN